jgi:site-specific DNA-methyltransferase (adenine-specific)
MPERLGPNLVSYARPSATKYPTERPLDILKFFIENCTLEGELVIDPCCGSGGHLVAAIQTNRRALGSDINPEAIKVTKSRLVLETSYETSQDT